MENKEIKYIVARYNEDIKWLEPIINDCIIYNKGIQLSHVNSLSNTTRSANEQSLLITNSDVLPFEINEIMLPNLGRETDTYLRYIIDNYDVLPDVCVFTQAKINDHLNYKTIPKDLVNDPVNYLRYLAQSAIHNKSKTSEPRLIVDAKLNNNHFGKSWNLRKTDDNKIVWYLPNNYKDNRYVTFGEWFNRYIRNTYPKKDFKLYMNGLFAITKEVIRKRPIEYYKKLKTLVDWHYNPVDGHFFERSWYYIFNDE